MTCKSSHVGVSCCALKLVLMYYVKSRPINSIRLVMLGKIVMCVISLHQYLLNNRLTALILAARNRDARKCYPTVYN